MGQPIHGIICQGTSSPRLAPLLRFPHFGLASRTPCLSVMAGMISSARPVLAGLPPLLALPELSPRLGTRPCVRPSRPRATRARLGAWLGCEGTAPFRGTVCSLAGYTHSVKGIPISNKFEFYMGLPVFLHFLP